MHTFADGNRYDGEWRDDVAHGRAVYTFANGERYEGDWRNGCFRDPSSGKRGSIGRPVSECPEPGVGRYSSL